MTTNYSIFLYAIVYTLETLIFIIIIVIYKNLLASFTLFIIVEMKRLSAGRTPHMADWSLLQ